MKKIKVFVFIPSLGGGGAERVSARIASCLNSKEFEVSLVVGEKTGECVGILPDNIVVYDLDKNRVRNSILPLIKLFRREKPDVVIPFMHHSNIAVLLAKLFSFSHVKVITAERNVMEYVYKNIPRAVLLIVRFLYRFSDASLCGSKGLKENVCAFFNIPESKCRVIYNPVDFDFINKKSKEEVQHSWLGNKKLSIVLGVGRLVPQKGFDVLIRAFALAKKTEDTRLIILGQGELREELLALAKELGVASYVDLPGFKNPYPFFSQASMFVLSSNWEGFSNVVLEAMAFGVPIVATDCKYGPSEIIENEKNGLLVPVGDVDRLAHAIERMLFDKKFANMCGENGFSDVKRFAIEGITEQYKDFISFVVGK